MGVRPKAGITFYDTDFKFPTPVEPCTLFACRLFPGKRQSTHDARTLLGETNPFEQILMALQILVAMLLPDLPDAEESLVCTVSIR